MIRSEIFQDWFSTRETREIFSDRNTVQQWLNAEAALAQAQAAAGLLPPHAAETITQKADAALIALEPLREHYRVVGYPILPLLKVWEEELGEEAARYVHWGATTQDITDTGLVLQLKQALIPLERDLAGVMSTLAALARKHRHTLMAGRTHGQHAVPITFGFKAAIWLAELKRHRARFDTLKPRLLVGQLAGAGGTLASLGADGAGIQAEMMRRLGLAVPSIAWHSARDSFGEFACCLALLGATLEKMAHEVELLQKNEIAELSESYETGKGASSTMPQKRNPSNCEAVIALGRLLREQVPAVIGAMTQEHERDWWAMHIEWKAIPEMCCLCAAELALSLRILGGLEVDEARMRQNLEITRGLILAEAVMMNLAQKVGRNAAHELLDRISMGAFAAGGSFAEALQQSPVLREHFSAEEISRLLDPAGYLGQIAEAVDRVTEEV
ncbi:MAG TPA: adenylosuccinate lyase family protein [Bryobacteraceae bacterium]|nr:adenylosuccinate lyase family protein [Bryobacteraceae bacterium]